VKPSSILLALLLVGCGKGVTGPPQNHGVFEPYFQRFEQYSIEHNRSTYGDSAITIEFGDPGENNAGKCIYEGFRKIEIDRNVWSLDSDFQKEQLILHELGHCLLNRAHVPTSDTVNNVALSIMYPTTLNVHYNPATRKGYLNELFGGAL
jgi:hypothetical protein